MSPTPPPRPPASASTRAPAKPGGAPTSGSGARTRWQEEAHGAEESDSNWIVSYADMMTLLMAFFAIMFSFSKVDQHAFDKIREGVAKQFGGQFSMPFEDMDKALQQIIEQQKLHDRVKIDRDGNGVSIVFQGAVFFKAGGVELSEEAKPMLNRILDILSSKVKGYPLYVEGHTDDSPISTAQFASNWELSAIRASLVVRMLETRGFTRDKLHPQGFADSKPVLPNRTPEGLPIPENQAQNRRVVIRIVRE